MSLSARERRLLMLLVPSVLVVLVLRYVVLTDSQPAAPRAGASNVAMAEQRLDRLRRIVAVLPARESVVKQTSSDLADRERGIIQAATAAQAQATLLEVARRVGKTEQIDVRGGDLGAPKSFGDYGLVYATIVFECHIEQLVNFLADLEPSTRTCGSVRRAHLDEQ